MEWRGLLLGLRQASREVGELSSLVRNIAFRTDNAKSSSLRSLFSRVMLVTLHRKRCVEAPYSRIRRMRLLEHSCFAIL